MIIVIEAWTVLALLNADLLARASKAAAALGMAWAGAAGPGLGEPRSHPDLTVLGLDRVPSTRAELRRAYRSAARGAHPDVPGGSGAAFLAVAGAFERLSEGMGGRRA